MATRSVPLLSYLPSLTSFSSISAIYWHTIVIFLFFTFCISLTVVSFVLWPEWPSKTQSNEAYFTVKSMKQPFVADLISVLLFFHVVNRVYNEVWRTVPRPAFPPRLYQGLTIGQWTSASLIFQRMKRNRMKCFVPFLFSVISII